jgi:hypothetical protein
MKMMKRSCSLGRYAQSDSYKVYFIFLECSRNLCKFWKFELIFGNI